MESETMYNLVWYVNGRPQQIMLRNKPRAVCLWKQKQLEGTSHRFGKLILQRVEK